MFEKKKERGIIGKALDVAVPVGAGMLAYKAMGSKPAPTSIGAASNARAATGGTGAPAPKKAPLPFKAIAPKEPTPRLNPAPSPTTLEKPDPTFKRTDSGVQSMLRDPKAYRDPTKDLKGYNKGPTGDRARRKEAANRTPEISIKGKPQKPPFGPQQMKKTPLRTGPPFKQQPQDYTPGKVGYEKTKYSPEHLKKQGLVKNAQKHANQVASVGLGAATLPFGGAAKTAVQAGGKLVKAAVPHAQKAYNAVKQGATKLMNKPIKPLKAAADKTGKIGKAVIPTTAKGVAGQAAAGTAIDKTLDAKSQKSKVKKTYRQHVQGIRN